jgi:hypothetical protein
MTNEKKKSMTSNSKKKSSRATGLKILGVKDRVQRLMPGEDPRVAFVPSEREDYEKDIPTPDDEASRHKFPPPKKHPTFRRTWMNFVANIMARENFKVGHLQALEILCDLQVEYEQLQAFVRKNGRSYKSVSRGGVVWKLYPEVLQLSKIAVQIKEYMKMMDLVLKKDHSTESGTEKESWD